ncbi:E3 ubiquitin-protein ligase TRAIP-like [Belonocnema kinseyi]|uniref:E3 ubiquitin-protein ligase TRAIP-like n=1 Tax=Belonocnema kinseyi TaxID=2817044 RepID=UPI00143D175B|nr:E3 ubiquitin-protein ligase TRAIP-like [Belonocnema kinseyi]
MNIVYAVCIELLQPSAVICNTQCGHIFHLECLTRWLQSKQTCPQCRRNVTANKINRVYLTFVNNGGVEEEIEILRSSVEGLEQELALKQKDLDCQNLTANMLYYIQVRCLRKENTKLKKERLSLKSTIFSQKKQEQLIFNDMEKLRKNLELYSNVKYLVNCAIDDLKEIVSETESRETLITYIKVMKLRTLELQQSIISVSHERDLLS